LNGAGPYAEAFYRIVDAITRVLGVDRVEAERLLTPPSRPEYGDLAFPLMRYARRLDKPIEEVAEAIAGEARRLGAPIRKAELVRGYLNIWLDEEALADALAAALARGWKPSPPASPSPETIVVEHTSANPIHQMHIGHARNTSLGDTLSRLLAARGHRVNRRFYVNDAGKQVAVATYGVYLAGLEDPLAEARRRGIKPDHFVGWIYAVVSLSIEAYKLKRSLDEGDPEARGKLEETAAALARLKESRPGLEDLFDRIFRGVQESGDPEERIAEIVREYEAAGDPWKTRVRRVVETVLAGFRETLARAGAEFDAWDYESLLLWEGWVDYVMRKARESPYYTTYKGAPALDIPRVVRELVLPDPEARKRFKLPKGFEIPPMILARSDGTTLYTTRDVAYTIYKFREAGADEVINVVGADQRLAQLQVRLALLAIGHRKEALYTTHYDYEMVTLPGRRMSSRRGEYVSFDGLLDSLKARALVEVRKRNPDAPEDWVERVAEQIAVGAFRFTMVRTSAQRPIVFHVEKALDLEENSGPYLQYTHARANSILRKYQETYGSLDYDRADPKACGDPQRRRILVEALRYPLVAAKAADDLAPELLAGYLLRLADEFNSWYQRESVIREQDAGARACKLALVGLVKETLAAGLGLLGVPAPDRM